MKFNDKTNFAIKNEFILCSHKLLLEVSEFVPEQVIKKFFLNEVIPCTIQKTGEIVFRISISVVVKEYLKESFETTFLNYDDKETRDSDYERVIKVIN